MSYQFQWFTYNFIFRPKYAVAAVKKKLYSQNPYQAMFALLTLESIVKNCGKFIKTYILAIITQTHTLINFKSYL